MTEITDFNKTKLANSLGMAKKAGKIVTGEELVIKSIQADRARLVFVAHDGAANLVKRITDKTTYYEIPMLDIFSAAELSTLLVVTGKSSLFKIKDLPRKWRVL
jgi:ribosomal protein L7Ae-like RNA K-turn-binding protein